MRLIIYMASLIFFALLYGCNSNNTNNQNADFEIADTVFESSALPAGDSVLYVKNKSLLWQVEDNNSFKLRKPKAPGIDTMSVANIIALINSNYDSIHLDYIKTSRDTLYVRIPNSDPLTESLGDTGAEIFLASTTYSLTELTGIKYVHYDFKAGDHASPGVFGRDDFKNFR
ncbi:MAG: hypothetical protein ABI472_12715 [Ginsengibacter sp.]